MLWKKGKENTLTMLSIAPSLKYFNLMQIKGYSNNKVGQLPSTYQVPDNLHNMVHIFSLCKHMVKQLSIKEPEKEKKRKDLLMEDTQNFKNKRMF